MRSNGGEDQIHHEAHEGYLGGHGTPCPYALGLLRQLRLYSFLRVLRGETSFTALDMTLGAC
jgi:hypothetical protein